MMSSRLGLDSLAVLLSLLLGGCAMGSLMIKEHRSPYDFDTTIATVVTHAQARGWEVPKVFDFQKSLLAHELPDPGRMSVIKLCSPEFASRMFAADNTKFVSVMAPCSISVYEKSDGHTYVAAMNMGLMSKLMGDEVGAVLADIAADDSAILAFAHSGESPEPSIVATH
ncbi:MAG: DUF302 domain-containing protein [Thiohalocapsa sp.]